MKINFDSLFEGKDPFKSLKESSKEFLEKTLPSILSGLQSFAKEANTELKKIDFSDIDGIEKLSEVFGKADKIFQGFVKTEQTLIKLQNEQKESAEALNKVQKQNIKLQEERNEVTDEQIQQNESLKKQRRERIAQQKAQAVLDDKEAGTLEKLVASNKLLRLEQKKLNLETEEGIKRNKEINDILDKNTQEIKDNVDAFSQAKINIGNYTESVKQALEETDLFGTAFGEFGAKIQSAISILSGIAEKVDDLAESEQVAERATGRLGKGIQNFGKILRKSPLFLLVGVLAGVATAVGTSQKAVLEIQIAFQQFGNSAITVLERLGLSLRSVGSLLSGILTFDSDKINEALEELSGTFDGLGDSITEVNKLTRETAENSIRLANATGLLEKQIAQLTAQEELQLAIADQTTLSFNEREKAIREAFVLQEQRIKAEEQLAKLQSDQAVKQVQLELERNGLAGQFTEEQIRSLDILNDFNATLELSEDTVNNLKEAQLNLIEVESQASLSRQDIARTDAELLQDRLERNLDFQIDLFDAQKTFNEKIIADDTRTVKERQALLEETTELANQSFDQQLETLQNFSDKAIPIEELLAEKNVNRVIASVRELELSEIIEGRLLEVLRERLAVTSDLNEAQKELRTESQETAQEQIEAINEIEKEQIQGQIDLLNRQIELTEENSTKRIDLIEKRNELEKQFLKEQAQFEIDNVAKTAEERELIDAKLQNDLANLEQQKLEAVKDVNEQIKESDFELAKSRIETASETAEQVKEIFTDAFDNEFEEREASLDKEEELTRSRLQQQQELSAQGLQNQAEFERAKLAEIEAERRQIERQRKAIEEAEQLASIFLNAYNARVASAETEEEINQAGVKALQDTAQAVVLKESAKGLAKLAVGSAFEGTEDTGTISGRGLDGKGGRLWMLHDNEGVVKKSANQEYSGLVGAMNNHDVEGWVLRNMATTPQIDMTPQQTEMSNLEKGFASLSNEMKMVQKEIRNKPVQQIDADGLGNIIETVIRNGVTTQNTFQRFRKKVNR